VGSGQWAVGSGQWAVGSGQWAEWESTAGRLLQELIQNKKAASNLSSAHCPLPTA